MAKFAQRLIVLCCCLTPGSLVHADLVLGFLADEPAPVIAELLAQLQPDGQSIALRPFAKADALTAAVAAGDIDLALLQEARQPVPGVAVLAEVYPSVLHLLVPASLRDAGLAEVLSSGPIWAGAPGGAGDQLARGLAADYGVAAPELLQDPWSTTPAVYLIFGGMLQSDALARLDGFQLYSLGSPRQLMRGSLAEGVVLRYPQLRPFILPAQLYPGLDIEPALTVSVTSLLVARRDLDETVAYELAMSVDYMAPEIAYLYPLAGLAELESVDYAARSLSWHAGALRYRNREQPGFLERYAEIIGAVFTMSFALGSVFVAVYRRRRQARKDRLDRYYQNVLLQRPQAGASRAEKQACADEIRAIQAEVFGLVVAERIDADGALVAFLSLSNQLLAEADSE